MNYLSEPTDNVWGLDIEGNALEPDIIWCVCLTNAVTGEEVSFREPQPLLSFIKGNHIFVGHNIIKYDAYWLEQLWKVKLPQVIDTLVLSQLYNPNLPKPALLPNNKGTHSLEAYGLRFKDKKIEFKDFSHYSEEMLKYCFQDVKLTLRVYRNLIQKLRDSGYSEKSVALEHQVVPIIAQQQRNGFEFNVGAAAQLCAQLREQQRELEDNIQIVFTPRLISRGIHQRGRKKDGSLSSNYCRHRELYTVTEIQEDGTYEVLEPRTFNIGSPTQRLERVIEKGYKPTLFTEKGNPKIDEDALVGFANESGIKEVQYIADWLVLEGRANMIQTWLNNLWPDNRIHGTVFSCGAQSRRMTHSNPNTANIPGLKAKYGKEVRELWVARPGRVLVGVDAAGLEGRMLLHHLQVPEAEAFFLADPHQQNSDALKAAGVDASRYDAKQLFYAFLYGAGNAKLGSMLRGASANVGKTIRGVLQSTVPGLAELLSRIAGEFEDNNGLLRCIDGGFVRCPSISAALNYKLQPDGAIFMKEALIIADRMLTEEGLDYMFVGNIHDEWQIDCDRSVAERVGRICVTSMEMAGKSLEFSVPLTGEYHIGNNWADTH